ncbi:MAG: hypothetical protein M1837_000529 [Sclerophora amabilis]|nr:MAG: hypothetical protein M1837_000529 [Sclerophora amabilis]
MASVAVPDTGLTLHGSPDVERGAAKSDSKPAQVLALDLPDGMLDEILKSAGAGAKGVQLSLGRTPSLQYGHASREVVSGPEALRHEIYRGVSDDAGLSFTGVMTLRLEVRKTEEVTAGADAAMLALQNSMAALDKEKRSNQTLFVADNSKLPPALSKSAAAKAKNSSGLVKVNRAKLFDNATTRSLPTSPSLGAQRSPSLLSSSQPAVSAPQAPNPNQSKAQAVRTPLIHLLAIRPTTQQSLVRTTRCSKDAVRLVLDKVGKQVSPDGDWRLNDRIYKDLDVWKFRYPSPEDRQAAIDNAVSAFDRQRLSKGDPLWQLLLPREERGKGKVLSKLHHLHEGPMRLNNTPSIKVQRTGTDDVAATDVDKSEAPSGSDTADSNLAVGTSSRGEEMVRSLSSQPLAAKKKVSEREAISKRLLSHSKNPKKPAKATAGKSRDTKPSSTKRDTNHPWSTKIKSAEFVHDSDEDVSMEEPIGLGISQDVDVARPTSNDKGKVTTSTPAKSSADETNGPKSKAGASQAAPTKTSEKAKTPVSSSSSSSPSSPSSSPPKHPSSNKTSDFKGASESSQAPNPKKESTWTKTSTSPQKPSPLGSSPPTNVSEMEYEGYHASSSSSTSPSASQARKGLSTPTPLAPPKSEVKVAPRVTTEKTPTKRKAEDQSLGSAAKRHHQTNPTPSAGVNHDRSSSDSASPPAYSQTLTMARRFKSFHAKYRKLYQELSRVNDPPAEKMSHLMKMHERLASMKTGIFRAAAPV